MITLDDVKGLEPPAIYNYEPRKEYMLMRVSKERLKLLCPVKGKIVLGCTVNGHYMFIRNDLSPEVYDVILRHEKAHVNGWKHK